jgi:hypothetical protein
VVLRRFGDHPSLTELIATMQPGDELRKFDSPREKHGEGGADALDTPFSIMARLRGWLFCSLVDALYLDGRRINAFLDNSAPRGIRDLVAL